jgi:hypothetical protein
MGSSGPRIENTARYAAGSDYQSRKKEQVDLKEVQERAADLDERRQNQIHNQRDSIDHLLRRLGVQDSEAGANEIVRLAGELAEAQAKLARVEQFIGVLRNSGAPLLDGAAEDLMLALDGPSSARVSDTESSGSRVPEGGDRGGSPTQEDV